MTNNMQYKHSILLFIMLSIFLLLGYYTAYGEHPPVKIDGTVVGCERIGGKIITYRISDGGYNQSIELCTNGEKYLRISFVYGCVESEGYGINPFTGAEQVFPTPCNVPISCDQQEKWGGGGSYYFDRLLVNADEKQYEIRTGSMGTFCNSEFFIPEEKKVTITARSLGDKASMDVMIPKELLSGEISVFVDGNETEYKTTTIDNLPAISFDLDFSRSNSNGMIMEKNIDIVGTQVIPEFPLFFLVIFASAVSLILAIRFMPNLTH